MTIRNLLPNPPVSQAIQRTTAEATEVLAFLGDRGIIQPTLFPGNGGPDMFGNGDEPIWFTLVAPISHWIVATPAGNGTYTFQAMDTTELEQRYNDLYTG